MTHSSYLLASPTDSFAKAKLMSQCLPYHPTDLSPYQRLKPCSPCQALLTQTTFIESLINPSCNRTISHFKLTIPTRPDEHRVGKDCVRTVGSRRSRHS